MGKQLTLGSLFDGIGGWQIAAVHAGVKPVWSSEIEPFPCAVTAHHFPDTKQLGDITKLDGAKIEPVDIICAGSPCQDLSIAGRQEGMKGARSGLFHRAAELVRQMRKSTRGGQPRFFVWENVPGAYSSNGGADFGTVLQEIADAPIPVPEDGKWANAGLVECDSCQIAWVTKDAQYFGVPQRRRRIFLVADFAAGERRAAEILLEPESLQGDSQARQDAREGTAAGTQGGTHGAGRDLAGGMDAAGGIMGADGNPGREPDGEPNGGCLTPWDVQTARIMATDGKAHTLNGREGHGGQPGNVYIPDKARPLMAKTGSGFCIDGRGENIVAANATAYAFDSLASNSMKSGNPHSGCHVTQIAKTLDASMPDPSKNQGGLAIHENSRNEIRLSDKAYALSTGGGKPGQGQPCVYQTAAGFKLGQGAKAGSLGYQKEIAPTLSAMDSGNKPAVAIYEFHGQDTRVKGPLTTSPTLNANMGMGGNNTPLVKHDARPVVFEPGAASREGGHVYTDEKAPTLRAHPGDNQPTVAFCIAGNVIGRDERNGGHQLGIGQDVSFTLNTIDRHAVCIGNGQMHQTQLSDKAGALNAMHDQQCVMIVPEKAKALRGCGNLAHREDADTLVCQGVASSVDCRNLNEQEEISGTLQAKENGGYSLNYQNPVRVQNTVRRLTPTECERLQALPDGYTLIDDHTCTDSARYKALGNGMAQPCADFVIRRIVEAVENEKMGIVASFQGRGLSNFRNRYPHGNGESLVVYARRKTPFPCTQGRLKCLGAKII